MQLMKEPAGSGMIEMGTRPVENNVQEWQHKLWFKWHNIMDLCLWFWRILSIPLHCHACPCENTLENLKIIWVAIRTEWPKTYMDKDRTPQKTLVRLVLVKFWSVSVQKWRKFSCTNLDLRALSLGHKHSESNSKVRSARGKLTKSTYNGLAKNTCWNLGGIRRNMHWGSFHLCLAFESVLTAKSSFKCVKGVVASI